MTDRRTFMKLLAASPWAAKYLAERFAAEVAEPVLPPAFQRVMYNNGSTPIYLPYNDSTVTGSFVFDRAKLPEFPPIWKDLLVTGYDGYAIPEMTSVADLNSEKVSFVAEMDAIYDECEGMLAQDLCVERLESNRTIRSIQIADKKGLLMVQTVLCGPVQPNGGDFTVQWGGCRTPRSGQVFRMDGGLF